MTFARVPATVWRLSGNGRLTRNRSPTYIALVNDLARTCIVESHRREKAKDRSGYFRARVTLRSRPSLVRDFHSAPTGYRAQYYTSIRSGEAANRLAVRNLLKPVLSQLQGNRKHTCSGAWFSQSLRDPAAKVWIHQGLWLRHKPVKCRGLTVKRWVTAQSATNRSRQKKAVWSMLTPRRESRIELIGGFVSLSGVRCGQHKAHRSREIHELGFT